MPSFEFNLEIDDILSFEWDSEADVLKNLQLPEDKEIEQDFKQVESSLSSIMSELRCVKNPYRAVADSFDPSDSQTYYTALVSIVDEIENINHYFSNITEYKNTYYAALGEIIAYYDELGSLIRRLEVSILNSKMYNFYKTCYKVYEKMKWL